MQGKEEGGEGREGRERCNFVVENRCLKAVQIVSSLLCLPRSQSLRLSRVMSTRGQGTEWEKLKLELELELQKANVAVAVPVPVAVAVSGIAA